MKAFPIAIDTGLSVKYEQGMDLRDYFAAKVVQALLTTDVIPHKNLMLYSKAAYEMADAMMEARKQNG